MQLPQSNEGRKGLEGNYTLPLILVTSLFFLWGLAYGLLDVLNKHFQETLNITRQRSTLLQAAYFGAYFLVALPAGIFMNKAGYKKGIIAGLLLYAIGALLFYPSASMASFPFFLLSLFILASGLTFLETAANPYITVLGKPETSEFRLNLSQSFNGVGSFIGPIIGGMLFFGKEQTAGADGNLDSVKLVYIAIAAIVLIVCWIFFRTPMPEIKEESLVIGNQARRTTKIIQPVAFHLGRCYPVFLCCGTGRHCSALHKLLYGKKCGHHQRTGILLFVSKPVVVYHRAFCRNSHHEIHCSQ